MAKDASIAATLRQFLIDLTEGSTRARVPASLHTLGRRTARRLGMVDAEATADDLVAEFLARLVSRSKARAVSCGDLLALDDAALVGALAHRLRQIGCELSPRWRLIRALRGHVRDALQSGLLEGVAIPPERLYRARFLSKAAVAEAASWLVKHEGVAPSVGALGRELMRRYLPESMERADMRELTAGTQGTEPLLVLEVEALCARLKLELSQSEMALLLERRSGRGLADLAATEGVVVSTVHARLELATARLRAAVRQGEETPGTVALALELLEAEHLWCSRWAEAV